MAERWVTYFLPHFLKLFNLNKYYEPSCSPVGRLDCWSVCKNYNLINPDLGPSDYKIFL